MNKICLFPPGLGGGGLEHVFMNLSADFINFGLSVDLLLVRKEGLLLNQLHPKVNVISLNSPRMLTTLPNLCSYLINEEPDVVLTGLSPTHTMISLAKLMTGVKTRLFASIHSTYPFGDKPTPKLLLQQKLELASYASAEKIITVSRGVLNEMVQKKGLPSEKLVVIYNPVLIEKFSDLMNQEIDHPFFAAGQPPVVLGVGRLTKAKNFVNLIEAFALALKKTPLKLIILGEGEERENLEKVILQHQLMSDVSLPGFIENPYPYMRKSKLFVLSSSWEGFGNVLVEAMACGCQMISTDCGGGPIEILCNGKYGKLVPVGNPKLMANAILESLQSTVIEVVDPLWLGQFQSQLVAQKYLEVFGIKI